MNLVVSPLHQVDEAVRSWRPSHFIGMASPGAETAVVSPDLAALRLTFHDIVEPRAGLRTVDETDVERLLGFARGWPAAAPLLVQCWAGVSRSTAGAFVIACLRTGAGQEQELAGRLRTAAPFATPNRLLVELADRTLGRGGAMIEAVAGIGRGAETSLGRVFVLEI